MNIIKIISDRYGPYAFGVASLLMIWFTIVEPELERNSITFAAQQEVTNQMQVIVNQQRETAEVMKDTARILIQMKDQIEKDRK